MQVVVVVVLDRDSLRNTGTRDAGSMDNEERQVMGTGILKINDIKCWYAPNRPVSVPHRVLLELYTVPMWVLPMITAESTDDGGSIVIP